MLFLAGANYEQDRDTAGTADCMPALLFVDHAILPSQSLILFAQGHLRTSEDLWIVDSGFRNIEFPRAREGIRGSNDAGKKQQSEEDPHGLYDTERTCGLRL